MLRSEALDGERCSARPAERIGEALMKMKPLNRSDKAFQWHGEND